MTPGSVVPPGRDERALTELEVSVVIPARNEEGYIRAAAQSLSRQTFPRDGMEVIVVDNGSTDATAAAAQTAAGETALQLRVVYEASPGISRAKNHGARVARGRILLFMDADSRATANLVESVVARSRSGSRAGSIRVVADSRDLLDRAFFGLMEWGKQLFQIRAQMFFCERDLFLAAGGLSEVLQLAEDREFLVRLQRRGIDLCHVDEAAIRTSPRRLRSLPFRLGMVTTFVRWALANFGVGRRWRY